MSSATHADRSSLTRGPSFALLPADPATAERVVPYAAEYMRVFFLGAPALFSFFVFTAPMRGVGDTRTPLVVMVLSVVVNVALDPFLIFGWWVFPALGVEGAAIATVTARVIATLAGLYVLFGTDLGPTIQPRDLVPEPGPIREIVELGVPTALEQSGTGLAMVVATAMVATFPPAVVAALTVVAVVVAAVSEPIVAVFLSASTPAAIDTIAHASRYLRISSVAFVFFGVSQVAMGTFRGAGNTTTALALSLIALWVVRLPATYLLAFPLGWGPTGVWTAVALGDIVGAVVAVAWLSRGTWKSAVIEAEPTPARAGNVPPPSDD
jgi:Na+-driven multidrug efflux pump